LFPPGAAALHFSFGLVGGASLTDDFGEVTDCIILPNGGIETFRVRYYSTAKDYIVGTMVELRLLWRLSVEADGLYRPVNFTFAAIEPDGSLNSVSPHPLTMALPDRELKCM